jgi:glycerate 2-kinase
VTHVLAAPDKLKGTATATQVAAAVAAGALAAGCSATELPLSDGGDGLLDVTGGPNRWTTVTGPLGTPVTAAWRLEEPPEAPGTDTSARPSAAPTAVRLGSRTAVIEMSQAAGLVLAGGREHNDAVAATTAGVGELLLAAVDEGARRLIVGCGGSATTDGGAGALGVIGAAERLAGAEVVVACDVTAGFLEAARRFGPQKGASPAQVQLLERRLGELAHGYAAELGRDVTLLEGSGAAGGLAGGLAAIGGRLVPGFELVASLVGLDAQIRHADVVVTAEGCLDAESFAGKVVGGVANRAGGRPMLCVAGRVTGDGGAAAATLGLCVVSLSDRFGSHASMTRPLELVPKVVTEWLAQLGLIRPDDP